MIRFFSDIISRNYLNQDSFCVQYSKFLKANFRTQKWARLPLEEARGSAGGSGLHQREDMLIKSHPHLLHLELRPQSA